MADGSGLWAIAIGALVDVFVTETAKRQRWIRIVNFASSMLLVAVIVGVIYITFRYST
jgi:hypothetical protein